MVREGIIEDELAALRPELVEPFRQARIALDADNDAEAIRLLRPIVEAVPEFDAATRRLGGALARQGTPQEGLALLEKAARIRPSAANLQAWAVALAQPASGKPSVADLNRAYELLVRSQQLPDGAEPEVLLLTAQLAFRLGSPGEARVALTLLEQSAPEHVGVPYLRAHLAAYDGDWVTAEDEIRKAGALGLNPAEVQRFLDRGVHSHAQRTRWAWGAMWVVAAWALGLAALLILGYALSQATLRQVERADPTAAASAGEQWLRRCYRVLLNVAGVYYYLSLPIVLLLVLAVAGGIIMACLMAGYIPIKLTLLLGIGAIVTIFNLVRSLFLRLPEGDPGRALERTEAPGLWALTEEVAATLQTRPIDEIRITSGTDLCVYEKGSWRDKLHNRARRVLVLGVAVLNDFRQEDFRSVLAHEYGHFANRDTAGGDVALRVQNDMMKFVYAMAAAGQATWFNVAFLFLRLYHFIFRRISHGATRLQEVLADRVAALHYGPAAFEGGLRHVIRQSILFGNRAEREVDAALRAGRPLQSLYDGEFAAGASDEAAFEEALNRPTTPDDTHPGPKDRFRLIAPIPAPQRPACSGTVWDLFTNRDAIVREMMEGIERQLAPHRDGPISALDSAAAHAGPTA